MTRPTDLTGLPRLPYLLTVLAAGLLLALSGCGTAAKSNGASASVNEKASHVTAWDAARMPSPCRTLTSAEVSSVVGRPASTGVKLDSWPPLCRFTLQPASRLVFVSDNPLATGIQEYQELQHSGQKVTPVTGLGDQAYWVPELSTLHVMVGQDHLKVLFSGTDLPPAAQAETQAVALARSAIPHLSAG